MRQQTSDLVAARPLTWHCRPLEAALQKLRRRRVEGFSLSCICSCVFPCDYRPFYQTICDYVLKTSIVGWDGTSVDLTREEDPENFAELIAHFGLLGVTVGERSCRPSTSVVLDSERVYIFSSCLIVSPRRDLEPA